MKLNFVLPVFLSAVFGFSASAGAQCTIDQNQPLWNGGTSERNLPGYYDWESFTAGMSGSLCEVDVMFCNSGTQISGTGILNVYDGTGIGGTLLSSDTLSVDGSAFGNNSPFFQAFFPSTPPSVVSGQVYTWQFIPIQGGGLPDPYLIQINIPDVYAGGVSYNFGTGGDITFATYVDVSLGINSAAGEERFVVYPNPANGQIHVKGKTGEAYFIYDAEGKLVLQGKLDGEISAIDIHALPAGILWLRISDGASGKIVNE